MKKYSPIVLLKQVTDLDGKPIKVANNDATALVEINVGNAFRRALNAVFADEPNISPEKKMMRYKIVEKIVGAMSEQRGMDLSTEEQAELKSTVGKMYFGECFGFLEKIIEGPSDDGPKGKSK